jgi:N6-adenosine-specific RNA methylase IME4
VVAQISRRPVDIAEQIKYRTILADPPWDIASQHGRWTAARHYPLMSLDDIRALRVDQLAAENSHLWLWCTNHDWRQQVTVMDAWGFAYKSCLTWVKPYFRLGQYLRNQTEHLLLGVRGHAPIQFRGQGS